MHTFVAPEVTRANEPGQVDSASCISHCAGEIPRKLHKDLVTICEYLLNYETIINLWCQETGKSNILKMRFLHLLVQNINVLRQKGFKLLISRTLN